MLSGLKKYTILAICLSLLSCTQAPNSPNCRVDSNYQHSGGSGGACLLTVNSKVLVLQNSDGKYDLPFRQKIASESSQCAAHRSAWFDTGINVSVGPALRQHKSGVWIYACDMSYSGFDGTEMSIPIPDWSNTDNRQLVFVDLFEVTIYDWQTPDEFIAVRDSFTLYQNYSSAERESQ